MPETYPESSGAPSFTIEESSSPSHSPLFEGDIPRAWYIAIPPDAPVGPVTVSSTAPERDKGAEALSKNLDILAGNLAVAKEEFDKAQSAGEALEWVTAALITVHDFLQTEATIRQRGLADPLKVLAFALTDRIHGSQHPLLQVSADRRERPSEDAIRGFVLHATDILHGRGVAYPTADKLVSEALGKQRIAFKATAITNLRAEVGRGAGRKRPSGTVCYVRKRLTNGLFAPPPPGKPKEIAERLTGSFLAQFGDAYGLSQRRRGRLKGAS